MAEISRRDFVTRGTALVTLGAAVPGIFGRAIADGILERASAADRPGKKLILVQLAGGNDGLNTLVPFGDNEYRRRRPAIRIADDQLIRVDDRLGLHPSLAPLESLWASKQLAVVQGVGYPNPNLSHFTSMHVWQTGDPSGKLLGGWLGRYLDEVEAQTHDPFTGFRVGTSTPAELTTGSTRVLALNDAKTYRPVLSGPDAARRQEALLKLYESYPPSAPYAALLETSIDEAIEVSGKVRAAATSYVPAVQYPETPFASGLQLLASIIGSGQPLRVGHITLGGFDTHAKEGPEHGELLKTLAEGLAAFQADIDAHGQADDVLVVTWSEFGRRVEENASGGTDHGTAAPLFVLGKQVQGGLYGDPVSLTQLDENRNLRHTTDFRRVYATIIERWLDAAPQPILGGSFDPLGFV